MSANSENFKNITAGIQSIVIAIALIIGGFWTLYTFRMLGASERSKFDRDKAQLEVDKERLAQERDANYGLDISVEAKQEQFADSKGYYISTLVRITNKGIHNRFIDFTKHGLVVEEVVFIDGKSIPIRALEHENRLASIVLRTGTTVDCPFVINVPKQGFYLVSFVVDLDPDEMKVHIKSGGPDMKGIAWGGAAFVLVK